MKFKVGDIVAVTDGNEEYTGIIVTVDEEDYKFTYRAFVYELDYADWYKESELTLKSPI